MALIARLDTLFTGDAASLVGAAKEGGAAVRELGKTANGLDLSRGLRVPRFSETIRGEANRSKGAMRELKETFGNRGVAKELFELGVGAGAVGGLGFITRELGEMSEEGVQLRDTFREDSLEARAVADELVRSVPILGGIYTTGQSIRELLFDEHRVIQLINDETAITQMQSDAMRARFTGMRDDAEDLSHFMRDVADRFSVIGRSGVGLELAQIGNEARHRGLDVADQLRKSIGNAAPGLSGVPTAGMAPGDPQLVKAMATKAAIEARRHKDTDDLRDFLTGSEKDSIRFAYGVVPELNTQFPENLSPRAQDLRSKAIDRRESALKSASDNAQAEIDKRVMELRGNAFLKNAAIGGEESIKSGLAKATDLWDRWRQHLSDGDVLDHQQREHTRQLDQVGWDQTFRSIEQDEHASLGRRFANRMDFIEKLNKDHKLEDTEYARMKADAQREVDDATAQLKELSLTAQDRFSKKVEDLQYLFGQGKIGKREFDVGAEAAMREAYGDQGYRAIGGYRMSTPDVPTSLAPKVPEAKAIEKNTYDTATAMARLLNYFLSSPGGMDLQPVSIPN